MKIDKPTMNMYTAIIYDGNESASLTVRATSAIEAVQSLWIAIHGDRIGFNYTQIEQDAADLAARDNAHAQWMGGRAGIYVRGSSAASGTWRTAKDCYTVPAFLLDAALKTIVHEGDTLARK